MLYWFKKKKNHKENIAYGPVFGMIGNKGFLCKYQPTILVSIE